MLGEIDRDFYCAADAYSCNAGWCVQVSGHICDEYPECHNRKHKWPTPEQFKEDYWEDVPDDMPVWILWTSPLKDKLQGWNFELYRRVRNMKDTIVCACTPWGKPPDDWRPE